MELDFAILAEAATAGPDGKMNLLGCGYDIFVSPAVPFEVSRVTLAARFLVRPVEAGLPHRIEFRLIDGDGNPVIPAQAATIEAPRGRLDGAIIPYPVILEFTSITFPHYGPYRFDLYIEDRLVKSVPLYAVADLPAEEA